MNFNSGWSALRANVKCCICNCCGKWEEYLNRKVEGDKLLAEVASWLYPPTLCCANLSSYINKIFFFLLFLLQSATALDHLMNYLHVILQAVSTRLPSAALYSLIWSAQVAEASNELVVSTGDLFDDECGSIHKTGKHLLSNK